MYQLVEEASKVLRTPPELFDFEKDGDKAQEIADKMSEAMVKFGGIGLSANQVGLNYRMFVMKTEDKGIVPFFNPELTKVSQDTDLMKEGCLSFPDIYLMIKRSKVIELKYQDVNGEEQILMLEGLAARCVQHEIDHLNGVLFLQRASRLKIERALKARPKEQAKRIEYEKRMAIARYLKNLEDEKAKQDESGSEIQNDISEERTEPTPVE
jgi:peptide deformylase